MAGKPAKPPRVCRPWWCAVANASLAPVLAAASALQQMRPIFSEAVRLPSPGGKVWNRRYRPPIHELQLVFSIVDKERVYAILPLNPGRFALSHLQTRSGPGLRALPFRSLALRAVAPSNSVSPRDCPGPRSVPAYKTDALHPEAFQR